MTNGSVRTAVYRLYDKADALLYVGISREFGTRWTQHAEQQPWWLQVNYQTVTWFPSREEALAAEVIAIRAEDPLHNIQNSSSGGRPRLNLSGFHEPKPNRDEIDHSSDRAVYRQMADVIRSQIESGDLPPGRLLPSEGTYAKQYPVSVDSVRKALAVLRSEGLITTERGRGSRVRQQPQQTAVHLRNARVVARMPTEDERMRFEIAEGVPVLVISKDGSEDEVRSADRTVVVAD